MGRQLPRAGGGIVDGWQTRERGSDDEWLEYPMGLHSYWAGLPFILPLRTLIPLFPLATTETLHPTQPQGLGFNHHHAQHHTALHSHVSNGRCHRC